MDLVDQLHARADWAKDRAYDAWNLGRHDEVQKYNDMVLKSLSMLASALDYGGK